MNMRPNAAHSSNRSCLCCWHGCWRLHACESRQTDGGYLGLDVQTFLSAVISGASGVFAVMLLQDAGISTALVVRPGQDVSVSGDRSLAQPPLWGSGGFTVQQRGALGLSFVALGGSAAATALAVTGGGSLSLSSMAVHAEVMRYLASHVDGAGSSVRLMDVTVPDNPRELGPGTGTLVVAEGDSFTSDPPELLQWFLAAVRAVSLLCVVSLSAN
jgi:hypothetical protein